MGWIFAREAGSRRTIAHGRHVVPDEAIHPSFPGQDHGAALAHVDGGPTIPAPRLDVITIAGGYVRFAPGQDGVVATAEGNTVFETAIFAQGYEEPSLEILQSTAREIDQDWVTVVDCGWHNHFHLLTLAIPKLLFAREHVPNAQVALPVRREPTSDGRPAMIDQLIDLAGGADGIRFVEDGLYRVRNLHIIWQTPAQPASLHLFAETYAAFAQLSRRVALAADRTFPRRFFIVRVRLSRLPDPRAERHLHRHLKRHGFAMVQLEHYSMEDQIRLFAGATHIVAAHGAGLSNIVFAKPDLRVLELNLELDGPGILRPWFMILAHGKRQHYQYLNQSACQVSNVVLGLAFNRLMQVRGERLRYRLAIRRTQIQRFASNLLARLVSRRS